MSTNNVKTFRDGFQLISGLPIKVEQHFEKSQRASIIHTGDESFVLPRRHEVTRAVHDPRVDNKDIEAMLSKSAFFSQNGQLIQMRKNPNFIHTDENIEHMIDTIGFKTSLAGKVSLKSEDPAVDEFDAFDKVPEFTQGGEMTSNLSFTWSPFNKNINTDLQIVRLVCANGMKNTTSLLNAKVPVVNNWEEHMQIARIQLQNNTQDIVTKRIQAIVNAPASVNDCLRVQQACLDRLSDEYVRTPKELEILNSIYQASDVFSHCSQYYKDEVFRNRSIAQMTRSHLSMYTIWNMLTELVTHTKSADSDFALTKMANDVLLSRTTNTNHFNQNVKTDAAFDNPEAAFISDL